MINLYILKQNVLIQFDKCNCFKLLLQLINNYQKKLYHNLYK
jgi:hypothetical protein